MHMQLLQFLLYCSLLSNVENEPIWSMSCVVAATSGILASNVCVACAYQLVACNIVHRHVSFSAESSVFANELKKDKFCVVSLEPGWVDTDMGGGNARKMGMDKAPTDPPHAISTMLKTIQQLSSKDSGEFLAIDGNKMDY